MAQNRLSGPGLGLPYPQALYPTSLIGAAPTPATNLINLAPGQALPVPGGDWAVNIGKYSMLQTLDPVTGVWLPITGSQADANYIHSDGQNVRIANLTGCPIGAVVTATGSGYVQASTTCTASTGGSVWQPIVGGALTEQALSSVATSAASGTGTVATVTFAAQTAAPPVGSLVTVAGVTPAGYNVTNAVVVASSTTTVSYANTTTGAQTGAGTVTTNPITSAGSGYTVAPLVLIPAPPVPGVQATAYATISSGTVSGVTLTNQGAGYQTTPSLSLLPSPYDPNYGSIVNATAVVGLTGAGGVTAVLCTNNGAAQATTPTLTIAGVGTSATATATMCWTATGASVSAGGAGYTTSTEVTSVGGRTSATPVYTNPAVEGQILAPRAASMSVAVSGTSITSIGTVYDGGFYSGTPTTLVLTNAVATTAATLVLTLGSAQDVSAIQPL